MEKRCKKIYGVGIKMKIKKLDIRWCIFYCASFIYAVLQIKIVMYVCLVVQLMYVARVRRNNRKSIEIINLLLVSLFLPDNYVIIPIVVVAFVACVLKKGFRKKTVLAVTIVSIYCMMNICVNQVHFNNILFSAIYILPFFMLEYEIEYLIGDKKVANEIVFSIKNWIVIEGLSVILFALTHISIVRSYNDMDWVTGTLGSYQCNVLMIICSFSLLVFWKEYNNNKQSVMWIILSGILAVSTGAVAYTLIFACVILIMVLLSLEIKIPQKTLMIIVLIFGAVAFIQIVPKWMSNEIILLTDKNYLYNRVTKIRYYENTFVELPKNEGLYKAVFGTGLGEYSSRAADTCAGGYISLYDKIAKPFESTIRKKYISSWNFGGDGLTSTAQASIISIQGELGFIGLLALMAFFVKKMRNSADVRGKIDVLYFLGLLFLDNTLEFAKYGLIFWMSYYLCNRMRETRSIEIVKQNGVSEEDE